MIYFIQCEQTFLIKIGYAGSDPVGRLRDLQTGSPGRLHLVEVIEGGRERESWIHGRFRKYRVRGEWFKPSPAILSYMARKIRKSSVQVITGSMETTGELRSDIGLKILDLLRGQEEGVGMRAVELSEALGMLDQQGTVRSTTHRMVRRGILRRERSRYFYPSGQDN